MTQEDVTITPNSISLNITPFAMASFAADLDDILLQKSTWKSNATKYFLVCLSIELAIKAILRNHGLSMAKIASTGHDFTKMIDTLDAESIDLLDPRDKQSLIQMDEYYNRGLNKSDSKSIVYFGPLMKEQALQGYKNLPRFEDISACRDKLQLYVQPNILHTP